jgi:hypothetical protein
VNVNLNVDVNLDVDLDVDVDQGRWVVVAWDMRGAY